MLLRVKKHLPPADASGLQGVLRQGSEVPSDGLSLSLMSAQMCGSGTRSEHVAMESVDRIRFGRALHMRWENHLGSGAQSIDCSLEHVSRVGEETDSSVARAVAQECGFSREPLRILYPPYAPSCKASAPPSIRRGGLASALGIMRACGDEVLPASVEGRRSASGSRGGPARGCATAASVETRRSCSWSP